MDVRTEMVFANVSQAVSAGDGVTFDAVSPQPGMLTGVVSMGTGNGSISAQRVTWQEMIRRMVTHITSPSATLVSGGSAGSVALNYGTAALSGIAGMFQGVPFVLSGTANTLSGSPVSSISTASNQIRKVLVTLTMSALPPGSSLALGGGGLGFVYGSAMLTSAGAVTSGGQAQSYFDYVPMPLPSANEIPVGWLNVYNSFATSAGLANTQMITDYRVTQGYNMSALLQGMEQP